MLHCWCEQNCQHNSTIDDSHCKLSRVGVVGVNNRWMVSEIRLPTSEAEVTQLSSRRQLVTVADSWAELCWHRRCQMANNNLTAEIMHIWFLRATAATAVVRLSHRNSVCPSVCPSHGWISQERCKWGSPNLRLEDSRFRICKASP